MMINSLSLSLHCLFVCFLYVYIEFVLAYVLMLSTLYKLSELKS